MSFTDQTADDFFKSLTGFDEMAIKKEFRADVYTLANADKAAFMRALIFIDRRRGGLKDSEAYRSAMELPQGESMDYFADPPPTEDTGEEDEELGEA